MDTSPKKTYRWPTGREVPTYAVSSPVNSVAEELRGARVAAAVGVLSASSLCLWAPLGSPSAAALPAGGGGGLAACI